MAELTTGRRLTRWALAWASWNLYGLLNAVVFYTSSAAGGWREKWGIDWTISLSWELVRWNLWAAFAPVILRLVRRFPFDRRARWRTLLVYAVCGVLFAVAHSVLLSVLHVLVRSGGVAGVPQLMARLGVPLIGNSLAALMVYFAILLFGSARDYYERFRRVELARARLEAELAAAQLRALKMQLQPHFLFNTLNSIAALQLRDVDAAGRMVARLGDFLRLTLQNAGTQEVTLRQELDFLRCYLDIELVRFRDRLTIEYEIAPELLDARVPNLVLQPIVENAIKHGISRRSRAGRIDVCARRANGSLLIEVRDDGPGLAKHARAATEADDVAGGVGLTTTRRRLRQLYGADARLTLADRDGGGAVVRLAVPFRDVAFTVPPSPPSEA